MYLRQADGRHVTQRQLDNELLSVSFDKAGMERIGGRVSVT